MSDIHPMSEARPVAGTFPTGLVAGLAGLYGIRMLGLFMILPVLPLYSSGLAGANAFTVGLALGAYGLTQVLLQFPFGRLSDRWGRRPVLLLGLGLFLLGSLTAALADTMWGIIAGRLLQGMGAVAAVLLACVGDWVPEDRRPAAMAMIGASIGGSFVIALALGPLIGARFGAQGVFFSNAALALAGMALVWKMFPRNAPPQTDASPPSLRLLRRGSFALWCAGIFVLHVSLTAGFVVIPQLLVETMGAPAQEHWKWYLGILGVAGLCSLPFLLRLRASTAAASGILAAAALLAVLALAWLGAGPADWRRLALCLMLFFTAFSVMEAVLPALAGAEYPAVRGAAMGWYATAQFLGSFVGGAGGGAALLWWGRAPMFLLCAALLLLWLGVFCWRQLRRHRRLATAANAVSG